MIVNITKLDDRATIPTYGTPASAGADLYALIDSPISVPPHTTVMIGTGLAIEIPDGYCGLILARSSLASKRGLAPANKVGLIDSDYRGEIKVAIHNHTDFPATVEQGERVAQIAIVPYLRAEFNLSDSLTDTERGQGGFGSTGTH